MKYPDKNFLKKKGESMKINADEFRKSAKYRKEKKLFLELGENQLYSLQIYINTQRVFFKMISLMAKELPNVQTGFLITLLRRYFSHKRNLEKLMSDVESDILKGEYRRQIKREIQKEKEEYEIIFSDLENKQ